jgi:hypothetical protein
MVPLLLMQALMPGTTTLFLEILYGQAGQQGILAGETKK